MDDRSYIVEVPYRGIETHLVVAKSRAEAMRKVDDGGGETIVDFRTDRRFKASGAWIDKPASTRTAGDGDMT